MPWQRKILQCNDYQSSFNKGRPLCGNGCAGRKCMQHRRGWVALFLFTLAMINYVDRGALSFAAGSIAHELGLSPVTLGYVFSSFLWSYVILLVPAGMLVDRYGAKKVVGCSIGLWSLATAATGLIGSIPALIGTRLVMGAGESDHHARRHPGHPGMDSSRRARRAQCRLQRRFVCRASRVRPGGRTDHRGIRLARPVLRDRRCRHRLADLLADLVRSTGKSRLARRCRAPEDHRRAWRPRGGFRQ